MILMLKPEDLVGAQGAGREGKEVANGAAQASPPAPLSGGIGGRVAESARQIPITRAVAGAMTPALTGERAGGAAQPRENDAEPMVEFRHKRPTPAAPPFLPSARRPSHRPPATTPSDAREMGARRVERSRWLLAGLAVMAETSARDLALQALCLAVGGTAPGFLLHFKSMDHYRRELVTLWEQAAIGAVSPDTAGDRRAREAVLDDVLETAFDAEDSTGAREEIDAHRLDAAMRAWARESEEVAEVVARVDRARVYALALLMSNTGLEFGAARERAEVFYAACLGFEALALNGAAPPRAGLRALATALLAPASGGQAINAVESTEP